MCASVDVEWWRRRRKGDLSEAAAGRSARPRCRPGRSPRACPRWPRAGRSRRPGTALRSLQRADGHWVFELEADATIPAEYVLLEHFLGEIDGALERKIGVYLRARQAGHGGWPLYAGRRARRQRERQGLLRAEVDRRRPRGSAHGARARSDPRRGRGRALQRVQPHHARAVRPGALARGAGDAGRDHAAAALVPVPPRQGVLLVAHGDRAAPDPDGARPQARNPRRIGIAELFVDAAGAERDYIDNPTGAALGPLVPGGRPRAAPDRAALAAAPPRARAPRARSTSSPCA